MSEIMLEKGTLTLLAFVLFDFMLKVHGKQFLWLHRVNHMGLCSETMSQAHLLSYTILVSLLLLELIFIHLCV